MLISPKSRDKLRKRILAIPEKDIARVMDNLPELRLTIIKIRNERKIIAKEDLALDN